MIVNDVNININLEQIPKKEKEIINMDNLVLTERLVDLKIMSELKNSKVLNL